MRKVIYQRRLLTLICFFFFVFTSNKSMAQFGTSGSQSTVSAADLTINGVTVGRGNNQAQSGGYAVNTVVGFEALSTAATPVNMGGHNTAFGYRALRNNNQGYFNIAIGIEALGGTLFTTQNNGNGNIGIGRYALNRNTGTPDAGNDAGAFNTAIGTESMKNNTTGRQNVALGYNSLNSNTVGYYNCALGVGALGSLNSTNAETAKENTAIGYSSLGTLNNGNGNIAIGKHAAVYDNLGGYFTAGTNNVAIGYGTFMVNGDNQLNIQNVIYGKNMIRYGNSISGNIGIGIQPVTYNTAGVYTGTMPKLDIGGTLRIGTVQQTTTGTGQYLYIDANNMVARAPLPVANGGTINLLANNGTNTITSTVNGVAANAPIVNQVVNAVAGGQLTTTVNGVASNPVPIDGLTVNNLANNGANIMTSTVNGVAANASIISSFSNTVNDNDVDLLINGLTTSINLGNLGYWKLSGNANTNPGVDLGQNYLGTSDEQDLIIATAETERIRVLKTGFVGINEPAPDCQLTVAGPRDNQVNIKGNAPSVHWTTILANETPAGSRAGLATAVNDFIAATKENDFCIHSYKPYAVKDEKAIGGIVLGTGFINTGDNGYGIVKIQQLGSGDNEFGTLPHNVGSVGINMYDIDNNSVEPNTANLHVKGTVRLQDLPANPYPDHVEITDVGNQVKLLVVDAAGNVFKSRLTLNVDPINLGRTSSSQTGVAAGVKDNSQLLLEIETLKSEVSELRNQLNRLAPGEVKLSLNRIDVVPNPITGTSVVSYKLDNANVASVITISDLQGKIIKQISLPKNQSAGQVQVSKNELPGGMYVFSIVSGNDEIQSKKVLVAE